jgi:hypothetical protein
LTDHDQSSWKVSQNASEFCQLDDVQESIRSQLRQEDKFTITLAGFRYTVKDYDGKWLVFRRNLEDVKTFSGSKNSKSNIIEIKIVSLSEANSYLRNESNEYHICGNDPVKVVKDEIVVVMAKRSPAAHSK